MKRGSQAHLETRSKGLDFVIRVIKNIYDGPRNTREVIFKTGFAKVFG